jgi:alpha-tubulin suppressor-like RCC1 family protein
LHAGRTTREIGVICRVASPGDIGSTVAEVPGMNATRLPLVPALLASLAGCAVAAPEAEGTASNTEQALSFPSPFSVAATSVVVGWHHACARLPDDRVACWGDNDQRQVAPDTTVASYPNARVVNGLFGAVAGLAAGDDHNCAIVGAEQLVQCWGRNDNKQVGALQGATAPPTTVAGLIGVSAISAGTSDSCAIDGSGLACWGLKNGNRLGDGAVAPFPTGASASPVRPIGGGGATSLASAFQGTCFTHPLDALGPAGVRCFGLRTVPSSTYPYWQTETTATHDVLFTDATSLANGAAHACAIVAGDVYCWGKSDYGQTGIAAPVVTSPRLVLSGATKVVAGGGHSCALLADHTVRCWGGDNFGQLGNGVTASWLPPVVVSGLSNVSDLAAGGSTTCAVSGGRAYCWGYNQQGQVGDGTSGNYRATPTAVKWPEVLAPG